MEQPIRLRKYLFIVYLVFMILTCSAAFSETIELKNGNILEGSIISESDETVTLDLGFGTVTLTKGEIKSIERTPQQKDPTIELKAEAPLHTAIITYKLTGVQNGTEIVYLDLDKNKAAIEASMTATLGGITDKDNKFTLYDGSVFYSIDLNKRTGTKMKKRGNVLAEIFGEHMYATHAKKQKSFLSKSCNVYYSPSETLYFWHGICLKREITDHPMGKQFNLTKSAVDIQTNITIPPEKFKLPKGIKIRDIKDIMKTLGKTLQGKSKRR